MLPIFKQKRTAFLNEREMIPDTLKTPVEKLRFFCKELDGLALDQHTLHTEYSPDSGGYYIIHNEIGANLGSIHFAEVCLHGKWQSGFRFHLFNVTIFSDSIENLIPQVSHLLAPRLKD